MIEPPHDSLFIDSIAHDDPNPVVFEPLDAGEAAVAHLAVQRSYDPRDLLVARNDELVGTAARTTVVWATLDSQGCLGREDHEKE